MDLDKRRLWVAYGGDVACFWRAVHNTFPLALVQSTWNLDRVYVGDTLVSLGTKLDILSSLGFGTGSRDDPIRIRAELVSDVAVVEEGPIFYCEGGAGVVAAFNLVEEQIQLWELARYFGLWPWTAWVYAAPGKIHVRDIQLLSGNKGSREDPFQLCGYYGPFSKGTAGSFITSNSGFLDLEVVNLLSKSFTVATYSVVVATTREHALLKLDYEPNRTCCMKLGVECDTLTELSNEGIMSPSLPVLVVKSQGWFQASGSLQCEFGAAWGIITKPLGKRSVEGMVFHGDKLCKLAFDVILGIYHLSLLGRKHRDVSVSNIVVTRDDQFMLVDLEYAYTVEVEHLFGDVKDAASSDCQELLFCLLELSGHRLLTRSDHQGIAINVLRKESEVLGEFAKHIYGLSHDAWPSFETWLNILGGSQGCNLPPEYVKEALGGRISSERFSPSPLAFPPTVYPSAALWIIYQGQTKYFVPASDGLFPLAKVKHAWNLSEVSTDAGELVGEERRVSDVCGGANGSGTREDPLRIAGKSGEPRFLRCQETVPEAIAALENLPSNQRVNVYTARVLVSCRKNNGGLFTRAGEL